MTPSVAAPGDTNLSDATEIREIRNIKRSDKNLFEAIIIGLLSFYISVITIFTLLTPA